MKVYNINSTNATDPFFKSSYYHPLKTLPERKPQASLHLQTDYDAELAIQGCFKRQIVLNINTCLGCETVMWLQK